MSTLQWIAMAVVASPVVAACVFYITILAIEYPRFTAAAVLWVAAWIYLFATGALP